MRLESQKLLEDMRQGIEAVCQFVDNKTEADFLSNLQLRMAVERGFEIIGEALNQLRRIEPALAESFTDWRAIISFRNVLIHGYSVIDHVKTWEIVQNDLTILRQEVAERLQSE